MAKPNLALIPATIGDKVYSILPSDGVGDFDFTRGTIATRINAQGLIETVASGENRLNYSLLDGKVVGCPNLLLEPARTNSITYSENFSQWSLGSGLTRTENSIISPDGTLNAYKIEKTSQNYLYLRTTFAVGSKSVMSVFVKKGNYRYIGIRNNADSHNVFDFDTKSFVNIQSNHNVSFVEYPNDWFRLIDVRTISSNTSAFRGVALTKADGVEISPDIPLNAFNYVWGAQLEVGDFSYPTSYIKTNGESGGVTRAAETCNGSGDAATFNDSEGVLMAEISALADISSLRTITIGDNSSSNAVSIRLDNANLINIYVNSGGANQCAFTSNVSTSLFNKCLIKYKANDFSAWVNGFKIGVDTSGIVFPNGTLDRLNFDIGYTSTSPFYGNTKQIQYYDSALTDSELETLTSWTSFTDMAQGQLYTIE